MPRWIDIGVMPVINLLMAFLVAGLIVLAIGQNPSDAVKIMVNGAFGSLYGLGYTLYYATNFIFTGLAVAVAFHAGLFNIGGEGQGYIGGLFVGLAALACGSCSAGFLLIRSASWRAGRRRAWAFIPAYLQAKRGSHIVITTIMFNFLAAPDGLSDGEHAESAGQHGDRQPRIRPRRRHPYLHTILGLVRREDALDPGQSGAGLALICCALVWVYLWRSRAGYELRVTGLAPSGGLCRHRPDRVVVSAMLISGRAVGLRRFQRIWGASATAAGFRRRRGFTGIAVA